MEFDIKKTLQLIRGGLMDHQATWTNYLEGNPTWQQTAVVLTGPMIIVSVVLTAIFSRMVGGFNYFGYGMGFFQALLTGLVMAAAGITIAAFVFSFLAGVFDGKSNFSRAFSAMSLVSIPAFLAGIVAALIPGFGFLISLAGGILSLVFMYKIIPLALELPDSKRVLHFVVSLITVFVVNMVLSFTLGFGSARDYVAFDSTDSKGRDRAEGRVVQNSGMMGEIERQQQLQLAASEDIYEPPEDGKLERSQVLAYVDVKKKTNAAHERYAQKLEATRQEMEGKEQASVSDLTKMYSSVGGAISAQNAEMEIVMTGGDNWAEHSWVRDQLHIALIQQGRGSEALEHNYALYEEFASDLQ